MKIAIAGYGLEGKSNYQYYSKDPNNKIMIVDEKQPEGTLPSGVEVKVGAGVLNELQDFDLVIRTAGLDPKKIKTNGKIWSSTNEFFENCPAPIIGVTGSKGKGTTASLIASILRESGRNVHLVGNIGVPALDVLTDILDSDIVVYELSSFQLWDAVRSPHIAVVLYIEPEHLDVHSDMDEYLGAKSNIVKFQTSEDIVIYNQANRYSSDIADISLGIRVPYQDEVYAHVANGYFYYGEQKLCSIDNLTLPGVHNLDNACAAISATYPYVQDGEVIGRGISKFKGLEHRLKLINHINGIDYYDDSIATTPGSAIAAIASFDQPKILILGGSSKGADFSELAMKVVESNVRSVVLIGDEAPVIEDSLIKVGYRAIDNLGKDINMDTVVKTAQANAEQGDVVILSPACASFGMFKNYEDRGRQFIESVKRLG